MIKYLQNNISKMLLVKKIDYKKFIYVTITITNLYSNKQNINLILYSIFKCSEFMNRFQTMLLTLSGTKLIMPI